MSLANDYQKQTHEYQWQEYAFSRQHSKNQDIESFIQKKAKQGWRVHSITPSCASNSPAPTTVERVFIEGQLVGILFEREVKS